ncbi:6584_t:CDS:10 [Ambispora gerdemannii]|uniref:DNA-directed RNA polymerase subunit n=1 Tax=Ambispora gerdemannii TaxID=144530 RepID=A0A9N9ABD7_9GLOM|nr:6584_t:CDS:10 [Ambispora gerdemannii]
MNISHPFGTEIHSVSFSCYSPEEIRKLSVKQITHSELFDNLNQPTKDGLYDLALGPFDRGYVCHTCLLDYFSCPGHFGHIELPCPVYNALFFPHMYTLLKSICLDCHRFLANKVKCYGFAAKLLLLEKGLLLESQEIDYLTLKFEDLDKNKNEEEKATHIELINNYLKRTFAQPNTGPNSTAVNAEKRRIVKDFFKISVTLARCQNCRSRYLTPMDIRKHLDMLFQNESTICSLLYGQHGLFSSRFYPRDRSTTNSNRNNTSVSADIFFLDLIAVPPTRFRPTNVVGERLLENVHNGHFKRILKACARFSLNAQNDITKKKDEAEIETTTNKKEKLQDLLNAWNDLQLAVNGLIDNTKVGAMFAKERQMYPVGIKQILEKKEGLFRKHMMGKRVNYAARSVISPDPNVETFEIGIPVTFAKILTYPEPVTQYNINEMREAVINGAHQWPGAVSVQHEDGMVQLLSRLSLESRIALANQLLTPPTNPSKSIFVLPPKSPTSNKKVLRHLRDGDILLLNRQPTLHKPSVMAHQAKVLPGEMTIRMHYANCKAYNADFDGDEMNMHFPQNEIARAEAEIIGNTNEQYLEPTSGSPLRGLIQDHVVIGVWMTSKDTFFTKEQYHQILYNALRPEENHGTVAVKILTVPPAIRKPKRLWTGKQMISTILKNLTHGMIPLNLTSRANIAARYWGDSAPEEATVIFLDGEHLTGVLDKGQFGATAFGLIHACYELYNSSIAGKLLSILGRLFTTYSQWRGFSCRMDDLRLTPEGEESRRNLMQNASKHGRDATYNYVGLDPVDDEFKSRIEEVFRDNEKQQGQQELEGRRVPVMVSGKTLPSFLPYETAPRSGGFISGLIDTAVKTSRSGYLQRCLIKHLEGLRVHYDHTVRDSDGSVIQFHYGEDSLDVTKQKYLSQFKFNVDNFEAFSEKFHIGEFVNGIDQKQAIKYLKKFAKRPEKYDPVLSVFTPSRNLGCISEKFHYNLTKYIEENRKDLKTHWRKKISKGDFGTLMYLRYLHSLVEPGESVGVLAAQGVGEPSTQMTLNTFHFAGFGAKNVTLGIPRLREIIIAASAEIQTPMMTLPLLPHVTNEMADRFSQAISRLTLAEVVDNVVITEKLGVQSSENDMYTQRIFKKVYTIKLNFFPKEEYMEEYEITPTLIKEVIEDLFFKFLGTHIKQITKNKSRKSSEEFEDFVVPKSQSIINKQTDVDDTAVNNEAAYDSDDGDGDATSARINSRRKQLASYEGPDEDDLEVIRRINKNSDSEEDDAMSNEEKTENARIIENPRIIENSQYVSQYSFDQNGASCEIELMFPASTQKILLLNIVEKICKDIPLREVKGIHKCYPIVNENDTSKSLATEGINLQGVWKFSRIIDINKIYTNDIAAMLRTYGVEAARATIIKEISNVFGAYGINVDLRHLTLIADYMTFEGNYKPFSRYGIDSNTSPFLKMSYETTCNFLTQATLFGEFDPLCSPSSRLVAGKVVESGTGAFSILQPISANF